MIIKIGRPGTFSEQGRKDQQEDRTYPRTQADMSPNDKCFVLCDGMGGHEKGEVAAEIVSETLYKSLTSNPPAGGYADKQWFDRSLNAAYNALDKMDLSSERRPGTTMTCVYLAENGVLCAHIGDSRIYQVRPGQGILYRSEDHSLVNQMVKLGEITPEEAEHHPKRNIITRAMQPKLDKRYAADIVVISDVKAGDYFFLCCDGILEQLSDKKLVEIISADTDVMQKRNEIYDICHNKTRDNYTCILIPITEVEGSQVQAPSSSVATATLVNPQEEGFSESERIQKKTNRTTDTQIRTGQKQNDVHKTKRQAANKGPKDNSRLTIGILSVLLAITVGVCIYFIFFNNPEPEPATRSERTSSPETDTTGSGTPIIPIRPTDSPKEKIENQKRENSDRISREFGKLSPEEQNAIKKYLETGKFEGVPEDKKDELENLVENWEESIKKLYKKQHANATDDVNAPRGILTNIIKLK